MMKHRWISVLRVLCALAGIAYIVFSLTWSDHLVLPIGTRVDGGAALTRQVDVPVLDRTPGGDFIIAPLSGRGQPVVIDPSRVGPGRGRIHERPGIFTTLGRADVGLLIAGLLLVGLVPLIQSYRWLVLLRGQGLDPGYGKSLRLTMVGLFFNFCMPGTTGGDVVKAYYAAKRLDQRSGAVMSVIFDRVTGMVALVALGAVVGLAMLGQPIVLRLMVATWIALALLIVGGLVYFSTRLRQRLGLDRLLNKLGRDSLLGKLHQAALAYRDSHRAMWSAIAVSLPAHLAQIVATALAGRALGMDVPLLLLVAILPMVFLVGSLPLTPMGLGVMEPLAMALLLDPPHATANQILGMLLLIRAFLIVYGLLGMLLLVRGDIHLFPRVTDEAAQPVVSD